MLSYAEMKRPFTWSRCLITGLIASVIYAALYVLYQSTILSQRGSLVMSRTENTFTWFAANLGFSSRTKDYSEIYNLIFQNPSWSGKPMILNHSSNVFFWEESDRTHFYKTITKGGLNLTALASCPMQDYAQDWEWKLLDQPAMTNPLLAANESTSRLVVAGQTSKRITHRLYRKVTVRVDVRDGNGHILKRGGDDVRIWASDKKNQASVAPEVIDLKNGSYLAVVPLLWAGKIEIKASIIYNKEILRAIYFVRNAMKSLKYITGIFKSSFGSETTLCSSFPCLPGYRKLCNLSEINGGLPWYCGRPQNPALLCRHFTEVGDTPFVSPLPLTHAEKTWLNWHEKKKADRLLVLPSVKLTVLPSQRNTTDPPVSICKYRNLTESWYEEAPRGYFLKNRWIPLTCSMPKFTNEAVSACLSKTTVLLLGDSNLRLMFKDIARRTGCQISTGTIKPRWHEELTCNRTDTKMKIRWKTHALPFHIGLKQVGKRTHQKAANEYIDEIPSEGKFLVVVHLYLHLTAHHYSVFATHIKAVRSSVERLFLRNPSAKVVIRGPHMAYVFWPAVYGGDAMASLYTDITKAAFKGLYDKVFFMQPWDMTVAAESADFHPPYNVNGAIVNMIFAHVCP